MDKKEKESEVENNDDDEIEEDNSEQINNEETPISETKAYSKQGSSDSSTGDKPKIKKVIL